VRGVAAGAGVSVNSVHVDNHTNLVHANNNSTINYGNSGNISNNNVNIVLL